MSVNGHDLAKEYLAALQNYLDGCGEEPLHEAYDLGRKAISQGMGVMHIAVMHHESLATILRGITTPEQSALTTRNAGIVEAESLSVFEMALRGYREANSQLGHLNRELQQQAEELARSNAQLQELADAQEKLAQKERQTRLALERTHDELKKTQSQLVHSAKLAALGQLVGGVAHEINNPLAVVSNNIAVLQRETQALRELLGLYRQADELLAEHRPELLKQIEEFGEQIDLPYLLGQLNEIVLRSRDALKRIEQIVKDLRDFGRAEESTFELVTDLNAGIVSTANILRGRAAKQRVELVLELNPLPPLRCAQTKINQVVLNLVANAIDACSAGGKVTLRTGVSAGFVEIHVVDSGAGIDPVIREFIFNPFFTTKPPGQGTGLGLSISHAHIAEHKGRIVVDSEPGRGSHFTVLLPLDS